MKKIFRDIQTDNINNADATITGLCYDLGASCGKGAAIAPNVIFKLAGFLPGLTLDGNIIESKLFFNGNYKIKNLDRIKKIVNNIFDNELLNIFIGGDHSVSINTEAEFIKYCKKVSKEPVIIHIDAHPDFCNEYDGSKYSHACTNYRSMEAGCKKFFLIGIRGFEKEETILFQNKDFIKVYKASDCLLKNSIDLSNEIIKSINSEKELVYLSFDIDAVDPAYAPGTGTPEAFGINPRYLLEAILNLFKNLNIIGLDFVEVSPKLDCGNITSWLCLKYLFEILYVLKGDNKKDERNN